MPISTTYELVSPDSIQVLRDQRQRREIDVSSPDMQALAGSIATRGIISPLIIRRNGTLVAGERRLMCARHLQLDLVPIIYLDELEPTEAEYVELEENIHRQDLTWQERTRTIAKMHKLLCAKDPGHTLEATGRAISMSKPAIQQFCAVAAHAAKNPEIWKFELFSRALSATLRAESRAFETELDKIHATPSTVFLQGPEGNPGQAPTASPPSVSGTGQALLQRTAMEKNPPPKEARGEVCVSPPPVLRADFTKFAAEYAGPKFNFIHCDFPYGIGLHDSGLLETDTGARISYADHPDVYFTLIRSLIANIDRLLLPSSHCIFWFSMKFYQETFDALSQTFRVERFPLLWQKSDNKGLLPDPKRGPRRIYETAFLCTRGDRTIVRPVSNAIAAPTTRSFHISCKPVPVLRHFFSMLIDEHSEVLDPTCGSGTSLIAAEAQGASRVLGLDLDERYVYGANQDIGMARNLRKLSQSRDKFVGPSEGEEVDVDSRIIDP